MAGFDPKRTLARPELQPAIAERHCCDEHGERRIGHREYGERNRRRPGGPKPKDEVCAEGGLECDEHKHAAVYEMKQRVGLAFTSLTSHEPGERHKRFAQPERDEEQQQSALRLALREEHPNTK